LDLRAGSFVELRGRPWLVEAVDTEGDLQTVHLACIADDAQGEQLEVLWNAEINPAVVEQDDWHRLGQGGPEGPDVLAAYLRVIHWNSATAAERDLLQAPFRAGIKLDPYQLLPLRKALRLPRVNLLIADDVGLGKTVEAGLVIRELLLRRRIDYIVVSAPPAMTEQWRDELATKFGLTFQVIDREHVVNIRRTRGFGTNPWRTGSRFIISHRLLADETYAADLREILGAFRTRAMFVLDEAHHAAPASGGRYAIASQFTKAIRDLADRFEHRLFLSATPHNGHSNSFSALLEMLDRQRFTRGVEIKPKDLEPVMVRRLKADLRRITGGFPQRRIEAIAIRDLPEDTPELALARALAAYGELRMRRIDKLPAQKAALAKLAFVGLQQRLLSSIAAFATTLAVHRRSLEALLDGHRGARSIAAAKAFTSGGASIEELEFEDREAEDAIAADEAAAADAASRAGALDATDDALRAEMVAVEAMLAVADSTKSKPDARVLWLVNWIAAHMLQGNRWTRRRLIIFTEYEDTRRWLERKLKEQLAHTEEADERILVFSGATGSDRREEVKRAFNTDPDQARVRILLCTDAAREGINLQTYCADLIHFDLPWNPSRLEQRNGRIDRKLQPAREIVCRYFRYEQREADLVLEALVRKTETIREELGSVGQVIEDRIAKRLAEEGIRKGASSALAEAVLGENDAERIALARAEMDDDERARHARLLAEEEELRNVLEQSRERVGVNPDDLRRVVEVAMGRAQLSLGMASAEHVGSVATFRLDPSTPAFAGEPSWADAFDDLRVRPRRRGESASDWRKDAPVRSIAFEPPELPDGRLASDVVQVHLEHRLIRRFLSRFLAQGFQDRLSRVSIIRGSGDRPRVVLMGRLSLFGATAARLHEEIIPITALWTDAGRDARQLQPLGDKGEMTTLTQLEAALKNAAQAPGAALARVSPLVEQDIADLRPALEKAAAERLEVARALLAKRGTEEATSLASLLADQRSRLSKTIAAADRDEGQLTLGFLDEERRERALDRRHWGQKLADIESQLATEPDRLRTSYEVRAQRLEPVGVVYLWPST
jgi:ERCC4-related helicase